MFGTELDMSDPRFQNEDLGDNSMKAGEYGIKNLKLIMNNLEGWTKGDDDDATYLKMMYNGVLNQYMYFISHVLKNVGGRYSEMPLRSNGKAESPNGGKGTATRGHGIFDKTRVHESGMVVRETDCWLVGYR